MSIETVFMAYANSQTNPLPTLSKEDNEVFSSLVDETLKGNFLIHRDSLATSESINRFIGKYKIAVFHFSGHAGRDSIYWTDGRVNSDALTLQLEKHVKNNFLKLVVLNGCSTAEQVVQLHKIGVPVVIGTSASVNDYSASAFAIKFYQNLSEHDMTIKEAYHDALGAAINATSKKINIWDPTRGVDLSEEKDPQKPLWGLFPKDNNTNYIEINPLPIQESRITSNYKVNKELRDVLFRELGEAEEIKELAEKEKQKKFVETSDKHAAILNVMPFPIGIQLKKLFLPFSNEKEGFDKISHKRIEQICNVFHTTIEFLGYIMLSQLWEEKMKREEIYEIQKQKANESEEMLDERINNLPVNLLAQLRTHFFATPDERKRFNYFPLIRAIREFFDSLNQGKGIQYFFKELEDLKKLYHQETDINDSTPEFVQACDYFTQLQEKLKNHQFSDRAIRSISETSESKLCIFFSKLSFLHKYKLTSVQNIYVTKFRHKRRPDYNHSVVKLMRVIGGSDKFLYRWTDLIDNPGIVLLNGEIALIDNEEHQFVIKDDLKFLNLSPFLLDSDAFDKESSQSTPMIFAQYIPSNKKYRFHKIDSANVTRDLIEIDKDSSIFKTIWLDLEYYRKNVLLEKD